MRTSLVAAALFVATVPAAVGAQQPAVRCAPDNGGITLPTGFCAAVFADSLPGPRHLAVAPNGDVFVALRGGRSGTERIPGGLVVLRDADGDGRAEVQRRTGSYSASEVELRGGHLYTENGTAILRYPWAAGALEPSGAPDTIVRGLPGGGHEAKTFALGRDGALYVNIGSRTNSCQERDRQNGSRGVDPCVELETRSGIWRFDAGKMNQTQADGMRFATGIRNAVAIAVHPSSGELYAMQHGRDQLFQNWPASFDSVKSAELPAEEMLRVTRGADYGWPYCYFDGGRGKRVLAPEYGGDGEAVGRCAGTTPNVGVFPAHWAPNDMLFYTGGSFPSRYRDGAFLVFHGSWNRFPLPQAGFNVVFQPMRDGRAQGRYEVFADGFVSPEVLTAGRANQVQGTVKRHRPTGIAQLADGSLLVADDQMGRIWRITYRGGR